ncbi:MAG TPA: SRPBCC family protein [Sphingomonas sp.]|nr:SRPBCC family protein [Sphingomonas sp.]
MTELKDEAKDNAPAYDSKDADEREAVGPGSVLGHTETINRPRAEVYAFWRDFANLARVMENVAAVHTIDRDRSHWKVAGPGGEYEWDSVITDDDPNRLIAWKSVDDAEVTNRGWIGFRDAPPGRGTCVTAVISYQPPGGLIGKAAAKLTQKEPNIQTRRDLRRLKQFLETGEIATTTPPNPEPKA